MSCPPLFSRAGVAAFAVLLSACGGGSDGPPQPAPAITIRSSAPADGATGVDRNVQPKLTLSKAVAADALQLTCAGRPVAAGVTTSGTSVQITPAARLPAMATCRVRVTGGPEIAFTTADGAWGASSQPLTGGAGHSQDPGIAVDAQGRAVAVWVYEENNVLSVLASRHAPGAGWSAPQVLGVGSQPQVAVDAAGNAIAIWSGLEGGYLSIWTSRGAPDGSWGPARVIESGGPGTDRTRLAMNTEGDAVVTWMQEDPDASYYNVWANRYVPGTGWQAPVKLEQLAQPTLDPVVAVAPGGAATVVWTQSDGNVFKVRATQSGRSGGWSAPVILDTGTRSTGDARVAASADGSFMALWTQPGAFIEVWARRFQPGSGWQAATRVDHAPNGTMYPDVAMDAAGGAVAAWVQNGAGDNAVWACRHVPGRGWDTPVQVESAPLGATRPLVGMDAAGNALVAWHQWENSGSTVWANRLPAGRGWGQARRLGGSAIVDAGFPVLAVGAGGTALAAWSVYDGATTYQVVFNRFD